MTESSFGRSEVRMLTLIAFEERRLCDHGDSFVTTVICTFGSFRFFCALLFGKIGTALMVMFRQVYISIDITSLWKLVCVRFVMYLKPQNFQQTIFKVCTTHFVIFFRTLIKRFLLIFEMARIVYDCTPSSPPSLPIKERC